MKGFKVKLNVEPNASPKFVKARTVPFVMQDVVEAEIDKMEKEGILKSVSFSHWVSPIVIVPKPYGNIRICGDYKRTINPVIKNDTYPQPTPVELFSKMQGGKKFSKIDLTKAYLQLELTRLPYRVKPASEIFQRVIENALTNISNTAVKIDDILISGRDDSEHLQNIEKVFQVLKDLGVTVNKKKCTFFAKEIEYVGFILDKNGVHVNQNKVKAINELAEPKDLKQLQIFLGSINYYFKFIPNMADIAKRLYRLIEKEWKWTNIEQSSFEILKQCLLNAPILAMYDKNLPLKVDCDASQYGLGAVLSHVYADKSEKPIAYASRTLNKSEINYSQVDKEGASIIFALKKFNQYLLGNHFILTTDNKAIKKIFDPKTEIGPIVAGRLVRWSLILSQYDYELEYRLAKKHCNPDMLSRLPRTVISEQAVDNMIYSLQIDTLPITSDEIKAETLNDHVLKRVLEFLQNGKWPDKITDDIKPYYNKGNELSIEEGIILWGLMVIIPVKFRNKVLEELHQNHPDISKY